MIFSVEGMVICRCSLAVILEKTHWGSSKMGFGDTLQLTLVVNVQVQTSVERSENGLWCHYGHLMAAFVIFSCFLKTLGTGVW